MKWDTAYGDVDGDRRLDLVVGAPGDDDTSGRTDRGAVTILTGRTGLASGTSFTIGSDDTRSTSSARLGTAVATGDLNGAGLNHVVAVGLGTKSWDDGGWITWRDSASDKTTTGDAGRHRHHHRGPVRPRTSIRVPEW